MDKLLVLPGSCDVLGGTVISLSLLIMGFEQHRQLHKIQVLVRTNSILEQYLKQSNQKICLQSIDAHNQKQFFERALIWVGKQPKRYPLLLDNCVFNYLLPKLLVAAPNLRTSGRQVYHFCHDTAASGNFLGYVARKLIFSCLAPRVLCNSHFTASEVRHLMPNIFGVLYQPVDARRFNRTPLSIPPISLETILRSGSRIMLTPSRISKAGIKNDKNLRTLIPILAVLKARGYNYCSIIIGEDSSLNQINSCDLLIQAKLMDVADRFFILPPSKDIENYYKFADIVVTLAPREPFGRTVVEAVACGVPVVGSRTGGIGEILSHFAPEWMVSPDDPIGAAEAIIRVTTDPNTSTLLMQAQCWVEKECSVEDYAKKIMKYTNIDSNSAVNI